MEEEIECDIQVPVFLAVPESDVKPLENRGLDRRSKEERKIRSGCQVIEINASRPISRLVFRNYYTFSVTVRCLKPGNVPEDPHSWVTGVRERVLMPNCHAEEGSQDWVSINASHFLDSVQGSQRLRLILKQPSPDWKDFGIHFLSCYSTTEDSALPKERPPASPTIDREQISSLVRRMATITVSVRNEVLAIRGERLADYPPFYNKFDYLK